MKSTGIVRQLDELGRVVLPKELRRTLDLNPRDPLEIFTDDNNVILKSMNQPASSVVMPPVWSPTWIKRFAKTALKN